MDKIFNIPIFEFLLNNEDEGIDSIALVEQPATEVPYLAFEKNNKKEKHLFQIIDDEEHKIIVPIMRANYLIYRRTENNDFEYYGYFSKETIEKMAIKMLKDNTFNIFKNTHNGENIDGFELIEIFIKKEKAGISPKGFENIEDGSLFGVWHISNEKIWKDIKEEKWGGISLEGYFDTRKKDDRVDEDWDNFEKIIKNYIKENI